MMQIQKVILGGQAVGKSDAVQRTNVLATAIFTKNDNRTTWNA